jgi:hypothetical protein
MGRTRGCPVWGNDTRYACTFQFVPMTWMEYNIKLQSRTLLGSLRVMGMTWKMVPGVRVAMRSFRGML